MKKIVFAALSLLFILSGEAQVNKLGSGRTELMAIDSLFNHRCQSAGFKASFVEFAAEDLIMMGKEQYPIIGKDSLRNRFSRIDKEPRLSWEPLYSDIAASGDLGYTFGRWKRIGVTGAGSDTAYYGVYVTVWKKQKDGSWKYVFDGGNDTPGQLPLKME